MDVRKGTRTTYTKGTNLLRATKHKKLWRVVTVILINGKISINHKNSCSVSEEGFLKDRRRLNCILVFCTEDSSPNDARRSEKNPFAVKIKGFT